jgi:hypothetical protein
MELKKGDRVVAITMGYTLREYEVMDVTNRRAAYKTVIDNAPCSLITLTEISPSGLLTVVHADEAIEHINCVENFYLSPTLKRMVNNRTKLETAHQHLVRAVNIVVDIIAGNRVELVDTEVLTDINQKLKEIVTTLAKV